MSVNRYSGRFHLRRLSSQRGNGADGREEQNLILLDDLTRFGRNVEHVDVVLTSAVYSNMISRDHATITGHINHTGNFDGYIINDKSLNGTYINDQRVKESMSLKEGDVIKFGHMNGAAIKAGTMAPQANAEFAFIVEKANHRYSYLGCNGEGRRVRMLVCNGKGEVLIEGAPRTPATPPVNVPPVMAASMPQAPPTSFPPSWQGFPPQYLMQFLQQAGCAPGLNPSIPISNELFQMNQLYNAYGSQPNLFSARPFLPNSLLPTTATLPPPSSTTTTTQAPPSSSATSTVTSAALNDSRSPPVMECDSSVPSPPKSNQLPSMISPKPNNTKQASPATDDVKSEMSYGDSPPRAPLPVHRNPSNTPSPLCRVTPDRKPVKEEPKKEHKEKKDKAPGHKRNEVSRLLTDLTEGSFMVQASRSSEKKKNEKKKEEKKEERKHKLLKQISDVSSDSEESEADTRKKRRNTFRDDSDDSDDRRHKHKKETIKKKKLVKKVKKEKEREEDASTADDNDDSCKARICEPPPDEVLNWIQCEACSKWYHTWCILGQAEEPPGLGYWACCDKSSTKNAKKPKKKRKNE